MTAVKALTYLMFLMFAMTTDSVGLIIPELIRTFDLSLTAAGTFQYATMAGIALAGLLLGSSPIGWAAGQRSSPASRSSAAPASCWPRAISSCSLPS